MLALKITDIKDFTNKLFIGEVFDCLWLREASITTFNTFSIDGKLQDDFFDSDQLAVLTEKAQRYSLWREIKPFCHSIIRGKRTPLHFKIIFQLPCTQDMDGFVISRSAEVNGCYLNLQYKNKMLLCTAGISQKTFSLDKLPEQQWDHAVLDFFKRNQIAFEEM